MTYKSVNNRFKHTVFQLQIQGQCQHPSTNALRFPATLIPVFLKNTFLKLNYCILDPNSNTMHIIVLAIVILMYTNALPN